MTRIDRRPGRPEAGGTKHRHTETRGRPVRVHLVSLGCPKNLVDSEMILGQLGSEGFLVASQAEDADVIVVNTCGFIASAKEESVNTILEACELKAASSMSKKVIVTGCLGQRYGEELQREIPELDAVMGLGEYAGLGRVIGDLAVRDHTDPVLRVSDPTKACHAEVGRFRLTPNHYAYLRISEGCDNPCTFCAIPAIRGGFRSKPVELIEAEARELVSSGARELILISQDTTSYGVDLDGHFQLPALLERLAGIDGVRWIRVLYAYPAFLTDDMIDALASLEKVVKYLDIPLQHISDRMLRRMGRRMNEEKTRRLLDKLRTRVPGIFLRTTFLVGFPGEEERDFDVLKNFVRDFQFERLGVFTYSREEGTPAGSFPDHVPEELAAARLEELMLLGQEIAFRLNRRRVGETVEVVVDIDEETARARGEAGAQARSFGEAPEIDPSIRLDLMSPEEQGSGREPLPRPEAGEFLDVEISDVENYDLVALPLGATRKRPVQPRA